MLKVNFPVTKSKQKYDELETLASVGRIRQIPSNVHEPHDEADTKQTPERSDAIAKSCYSASLSPMSLSFFHRSKVTRSFFFFQRTLTQRSISRKEKRQKLSFGGENYSTNSNLPHLFGPKTRSMDSRSDRACS
jgi:hypothetical protein